MKQPGAFTELARHGWPTWRALWAIATVCLFATAAAGQPPAEGEPAPSVEPAASTAPLPATGVNVGRDGESPGSRSIGPIQYAGPDTYILLDAEGRALPMPGMTYEDFMKAWRASQTARPAVRQPRYVLESFDIRGRIIERHAELEAHLVVRLVTDEPVEVPLALGGTILQGPPQFSRVEASGTPETSGLDVSSADASSDPAAAEGSPDLQAESQAADDGGHREYLLYDPARGGFVAGFAARPGERRQLRLELLVPLEEDGAETALPLNCPRALRSTLAVDVPTTVSEASVSDGALLHQAPIEEGGTRLVADGVAGEVRLAWFAPDGQRSELASVLSATGSILVSIDGRSVRTDAHLTVQSYGGGFQRFRVRLPPGAKLTQSPADDVRPAPYRISVQAESRPAEAAPTGADDRQIVLVELPERQQGPVVVHLSTEQPLGLSGVDLTAELAGFEVLGAVRQFGDIALSIADDWLPRWEIGQYVRQVDPSDIAGSLQPPNLTAAFQYDRQPWTLGIRVGARRFRVQVTPEYEMDCLPDELRLAVELNYQVLGARAFEFRVDLQGWELTADPVESAGIVDRNRLMVTREGMLVMPLNQAAPRRATVSFQVRRPLARDARQFRVALPIPVAESIVGGELTVRAATGVELLPDLAGSSGLAPTPFDEESGSQADLDDHTLHFQCFLPEPVFAAERFLRSREVAASIATRVELAPAGASDAGTVEQRIDYVVRNEALRELLLDIPVRFPLQAGAIEIALLPIFSTGGDAPARDLPREFLTAVAEPATSDAPETRRYRLTLPQPRVGAFAIRLRYPISRSAGRFDAALSVPLVLPVDGTITEQRATLRAPPEMQAGLNPAAAERSSWQPALGSAPPRASDGVVELVAAERESELPLAVNLRDANLPAPVVVDRIWLQSWLTQGLRQDRAAFRFRTEGSVVAVELPPQISPDEVEVRIDSQPARVVALETGRIVVQIAPASIAADTPGAAIEPGAGPAASAATQTGGPVHTLELRYRQTSRQPLVSRWPITPPQLVGMTSLGEVYWHIVLPGGRHIIRSPSQLSSASQWQWLGSFWGRQPTLNQADLEFWVGASGQLAPSATHNEYLYSGLGPIASIEVVLAPRWLIVLVASSLVLAFALAWVYVPAVRQDWILVALAFLLAGAAIAFPTPALLLAQASALGLVLASAAMILARLLTPPPRWRAAISSSSKLRAAPIRPDSFVVQHSATSPTTIPVAALPVPDSER